MEIAAAKWKCSDLIRVLFIIECSRSLTRKRAKTKDEKRRRKTKAKNKVRTAERQNGRKTKMELLSDNLFSDVI